MKTYMLIYTGHIRCVECTLLVAMLHANAFTITPVATEIQQEEVGAFF